jgi:hypothetical protein
VTIPLWLSAPFRMAASVLLAVLPMALQAIGMVKADEPSEVRFGLDPLRWELS